MRVSYLLSFETYKKLQPPFEAIEPVGRGLFFFLYLVTIEVVGVAMLSGQLRGSLARIKTFLSGAFKTAKRLGVLDGINPMMDVSTPEGADAQDTYAYSLDEVKEILAAVGEPTRTIVLTAAFTGLRKGEIRGLEWQDFNGKELSVQRSMWNSTANEPKTKYSKAPVPVVKALADALEEHRERMGKLAVGPNLSGRQRKASQPGQPGPARDYPGNRKVHPVSEVKGRSPDRWAHVRVG
jgi:integrase